MKGNSPDGKDLCFGWWHTGQGETGENHGRYTILSYPYTCGCYP